MELHALTAMSPIDGRYRNQLHHLEEYFSEYALIKYRLQVEIEYLMFLSEKRFFPLSAATKKTLLTLLENFSLEEALEIKKIERNTNHDVKAVEYFLKTKLDQTKDRDTKEWIHFGLTSQDINNTAIPMLWKHAVEIEYLPFILNLKKQLTIMAKQWRNTPMLARTHGQAASPTTLGKEMMVFVERIQNQVELLIQIPFTAKF